MNAGRRQVRAALTPTAGTLTVLSAANVVKDLLAMVSTANQFMLMNAPREHTNVT